MAAARSSDWMFRAIDVLPPSPSTADLGVADVVRQCRTLPVHADLPPMVGGQLLHFGHLPVTANVPYEACAPRTCAGRGPPPEWDVPGRGGSSVRRVFAPPSSSVSWTP
ncbi:hypothetical protein SLITK23_16570 [Streptomyces lividans]|nr:hypothetical protein SLITK23_16570 [Streptomyces lividans]